jgi:hypothetical protein
MYKPVSEWFIRSGVKIPDNPSPTPEEMWEYLTTECFSMVHIYEGVFFFTLATSHPKGFPDNLNWHLPSNRVACFIYADHLGRNFVNTDDGLPDIWTTIPFAIFNEYKTTPYFRFFISGVVNGRWSWGADFESSVTSTYW